MIKALQEATRMLAELLSGASADDSLSDEELKSVTSALESMLAAIECELAQREEAMSVAGEQGRPFRVEV